MRRLIVTIQRTCRTICPFPPIDILNGLKSEFARAPRMHAHRLLSSTTLLLLSALPIHSQTGSYLNAPVLAPNSDLVIAIAPGSRTLLFRSSKSSNLQPLPSDQLLVHNPFRVALWHFNPLVSGIKVESIDVADPAQATLQKLLDDLQSVATTVGGGAPAHAIAPAAAPKPNCAVTEPAHARDTLSKTKVAAASWPHKIDASWIPHATYASALTPVISDIGDQLTSLNEAGKKLAACPGDLAGEAMTVELYAQLQDVADMATKISDAVKGLTDLQTALNNDLNPSLWDVSGTAFIVDQTIDPNEATEKKVTITVTEFTLDGTTFALTQSGTPITVTFTARKYRALFPEPGLGVVFSFIDIPTYGTGTNSSNETVVALASTKQTSIAPTGMVNFVCRCDAGGIAPMFQIGAAVSTTLPAILFGGGLRLFTLGKGDFAAGGGVALGWYKDLSKLHVGSVITGTADINADLSFISAPKPAPYISLQYKF